MAPMALRMKMVPIEVFRCMDKEAASFFKARNARRRLSFTSVYITRASGSSEMKLVAEIILHQSDHSQTVTLMQD